MLNMSEDQMDDKTWAQAAQTRKHSEVGKKSDCCKLGVTLGVADVDD